MSFGTRERRRALVLLQVWRTLLQSCHCHDADDEVGFGTDHILLSLDPSPLSSVAWHIYNILKYIIYVNMFYEEELDLPIFSRAFLTSKS